MPASTMDSITSVLKHTFSKAAVQNQNNDQQRSSSASSSLEAKLLSTTKKTLLSSAPVFDQPVRQLGNTIEDLIKKNGVIHLNPKNAAKNENGGAKEAAERNGQKQPQQQPQQPPVPKHVFFNVMRVEVGYSGNRTPGAGMFNMGNTCYLNSTLQALFHTPALYNYLMSGDHQSKCRQSLASNGFIQTCMICVMTNTLKDTLRSNVTRPNKVYEKLKLICKHLVHGRQEDAHEFLRYLIESLQRAFLNSTTFSLKSLDNASKETTPFNQIFGGYMQQEVTCMVCKYNSVTFQHFMDLLLDIRQASSITDALDYYFRPERIGGTGAPGDSSGMYKCDKCKAKVPARKRSFICRPPVVLCVQLKRFSLMGGKISKPVQLSRIINIGKYVKSKAHLSNDQQPKQMVYRLVSMITNVGPSPNCGHYTAIGEAGPGQYYQFDDSSVRPISTQQVLNTASYVIMYEMTKQTKQAWLNGGSEVRSNNGVRNGSGTSPAPQRPSATVTSGSLLRQPPTPQQQQQGNNQPRLIGVGGKLAPSSAGGSSQVNSIGVRKSPVVGPQPEKKMPGKLVPYQDNSSDSEDETDSRPVTPASSGPFVPRAVTMNSILKRNNGSTAHGSNGSAANTNGDREQHTPTPSSSQERPPSAASSTCSSSSVTKQSRSGTWTVTDNNDQAASVHSDNSTGSTSGSWKVTSNNKQQQQSEQPPRQQVNGATVVSREPFRPDAVNSYSSATPSSLASTPEHRIKRGSSMEEYEAELDRGRSKKVKKRHDDSQTFGRPFNNGNQNAFQAVQDRSYGHHQSEGQKQQYSANTWNGFGNKWGGGGGGGRESSQHRDHSYHSGGGDDRGKFSGGGGNYKRSQSTSSMNRYNSGDYYRDSHRQRSRERHWHGGRGDGGGRHHNGGNRGYGGGGGGGNREYRDNYNRYGRR